MYKEKQHTITNTKSNKTLYDAVPSNEYDVHNFLRKGICKVSNQYICEPCDYMTSRKSSYDMHLTSKKHNENTQNNKKTHGCDICDYYTYIKRDYENHLSSKKHKKNYAMTLDKSNIIYSCVICDYTTSIKCNYNKHQKSKSHIHKTQINEDEDEPKKKDSQSYSSIMDEIKNMMLEQTTKIIEEKTTKIAEEQAKMNQMITEIANKPVSNIVSNISNNTISNNTHNNENNNHFNLNMFLNETCKDAMNITDFMKNLTVTMEDMELTGKLGFVKGMTRIIVNNLNALEVCKRPIHCSDAKRETLYVKNNGVWEKETDDKKFTKALIRSMRDLSDIQLSKWRYLPKNKGYERYDHHKNSEFLILVYEIHQFREEEIDKLIRNIIRHVVIDKSLYARSSQII
jgi:histone H3/H4